MTKDEAKTSVRNQVESSMIHKQFFNVCFSVVDGKVVIKETSFEFPFRDFEIALDLMVRAIEQKKGMVAAPEPLPLAPHLIAEPVVSNL